MILHYTDTFLIWNINFDSFEIGIYCFQCETVLEIDSNNVKAYYRRGQSQSELGDPNAALEDFEKVIYMFFRIYLLF